MVEFFENLSPEPSELPWKFLGSVSVLAHSWVDESVKPDGSGSSDLDRGHHPFGGISTKHWTVKPNQPFARTGSKT